MRATIVRSLLCLLMSSSSVVVSAPSSQLLLPAEDRTIDDDFEDIFAVGKEAGADHELLFGLVDIAFAPDGELYVLEEGNHRVLVFGPDGGFRRQFGSEGQGPGEFRLPMTLAVTANDEIAVWDFQNRGYSIFTRAGDYLRNVRWDDWQTGPRRDSLHPWSGGGVVYLPPLLHEDFHPPEDLDRGAIMHEPLGAVGAPEEIYTVHDPRRRPREVAGTLVINTGPVFAPFARWDVLSGGRLAVADGVDYRVRVVRLAADETTYIERPISPRPARPVDRDSVRERERRAYESSASGFSSAGSAGGERGSSRIREIVDAIEFADVIPVIRDLRVDFGDRLWIQRHGETYVDDGPIDIVNAAGDYLGTLPAMAMPDAFGPDGLVAWMERGDSVDVERVLVRRLPPRLR